MSYEREFQEAIALGITNGDRPDEPATRREVAVMCYRAYLRAKAHHVRR